MAETRVDPNPYSPFATADPDLRHLIVVPLPGSRPEPGRLVLTGCDRMAVVPDDVVRIADDLPSPDGACPVCFLAMATLARGLYPSCASLPPATCGTCGSISSQGAMCAICRATAHEEWHARRRGL